MKYYNGGFMIISYEKELIYQTCIIEGLSSTILTISNSVRPTFPDYWFFLGPIQMKINRLLS